MKTLRAIDSPQGPTIRFADGREAICLCSNDYLGLAAEPRVVEAAAEGLRRYGAGTASVRFICGLFTPHLELERDLAEFLGRRGRDHLHVVLEREPGAARHDSATSGRGCSPTSSTTPRSSTASASPAPAARPSTSTPTSARSSASSARSPTGARRLIVTDGVFSMEGDLAPLPDLVELAERHDATLIVDDSHGIGVLGETGAGTAEHFGLAGRIDVITGTLGKALGGAAGGFVAGSEALCELLEQRSRGQLFSNGLPQSVACGAREALAVLREEPARLRAAARERRPLPRRRRRRRPRAARRRERDRPGDRRRDERRDRPQREAPRRGRLRDRLRLSRSCPRERPGSARSSQPRSATSRSTPRWRRSRSTLSGSPSALPGAPRT